MRLSAILGMDVLDGDGLRAGSVGDVRLIQDGPLLGAFAGWRVSGLIVLERGNVRLCGYQRDVGPFFIRWIVRRLAGQVWFVPWSEIDEVSTSRVLTRTAKSRWEALEDLPDRRSGAVDR